MKSLQIQCWHPPNLGIRTGSGQGKENLKIHHRWCICGMTISGMLLVLMNGPFEIWSTGNSREDNLIFEWLTCKRARCSILISKESSTSSFLESPLKQEWRIYITFLQCWTNWQDFRRVTYMTLYIYVYDLSAAQWLDLLLLETLTVLWQNFTSLLWSTFWPFACVSSYTTQFPRHPCSSYLLLIVLLSYIMSSFIVVYLSHYLYQTCSPMHVCVALYFTNCMHLTLLHVSESYPLHGIKATIQDGKDLILRFLSWFSTFTINSLAAATSLNFWICLCLCW